MAKMEFKTVTRGSALTARSHMHNVQSKILPGLTLTFERGYQ